VTAGAIESLQRRGIARLVRGLGLIDRGPHHDHVVPTEDPEPSSP
jgi:hypothetical protein